jgi:pSer/pThr/pTyr-binding forkhead associated (FHA) protein
MKSNEPFSTTPDRERELAEALEGHTLFLEGRELPRAERKALQKWSGNPEFEALKRFIEFAQRAAIPVRPSAAAAKRMEETVVDKFRQAQASRRQRFAHRYTAAASPLPVGTDSELAQAIYLEPDADAIQDDVPNFVRTVGAVDAPSRGARSDSVRVFFEITEDGETIRDVEVTLYDAVFGRGDAPFRLDGDAQISRRHFRLLLLDGQVVVTDLDSRNGLDVNDVRVSEPTPLDEGDRIQVGRICLTLDRVEPLSPGYARAILSSDRGDRFTVHLSECLLGRSRSVNVPLKDDSRRLSRRHARLDLSDSRVFLTDLGSANGILLGDTRVEGSIVLEAETELRLGGVIVRVIGFTRA